MKIQMLSRLWQNTLIKVLDSSKKQRLSLLFWLGTSVFDSSEVPFCLQAKAGSLNLTTTAKAYPPSSVSEPNTQDNVVKVCVS